MADADDPAAALAEAAEDVHQETWITVSKNAASFDPGRARFAAWLFTIARHRAIDALHHQHMRVVVGAIESRFAEGAGHGRRDRDHTARHCGYKFSYF